MTRRESSDSEIDIDKEAFVEDEEDQLPTQEEWRLSIGAKYIKRVILFNLCIVGFWMFLTLTQLRYRQIVLDDFSDDKLGWPTRAERWRFAVCVFSLICAIVAFISVRSDLRNALIIVAFLQVVLFALSIVVFVFDVIAVPDICVRVLIFTGSCWLPQYYLTTVFDLLTPIALLIMCPLLVMYAMRYYDPLLWLFRGEARDPVPLDNDADYASYICNECGLGVLLSEREPHTDHYCPKPVHCRFCNLEFKYCDLPADVREYVRSTSTVNNRPSTGATVLSDFEEEPTFAMDGTLEHSQEVTNLMRKMLIQQLQQHLPICPFKDSDDEDSNPEPMHSANVMDDARSEVDLASLELEQDWAAQKVMFLGDSDKRRQLAINRQRARTDMYLPGLGCEITDYVAQDGSGNGLLVLRTRPGGPAAKAGILPGDVIMRVGDYHFRNREEYKELITNFRPFEQIICYLHRPNSNSKNKGVAGPAAWKKVTSLFQQLKFKVFTDCRPPMEHEAYWLLVNGLEESQLSIFRNYFNNYSENNSTLTYAQYRILIKDLRKDITDEDEKYMYMLMDVDNSGEVEFVEFLYWLELFGFIDEVLWQQLYPDHRHPPHYIRPQIQPNNHNKATKQIMDHVSMLLKQDNHKGSAPSWPKMNSSGDQNPLQTRGT